MKAYKKGLIAFFCLIILFCKGYGLEFKYVHDMNVRIPFCIRVVSMEAEVVKDGDTGIYCATRYVFDRNRASRVADDICNGDFDCLHSNLPDVKYQILWNNFRNDAHQHTLRQMELLPVGFDGFNRIFGYYIFLMNPGEKEVILKLNAAGLVIKESVKIIK